MPAASVREMLRETAERLPESASLEEAMERLLLLAKIEQGREDADAGRTISHEELKRRLGL